MKYTSQDVKVTLRDDGRYQCRVILSFELNEQGKRCNYRYKYIYGVDRNDVLIKRAEFIEEQIRSQTQTQVTNALLTTKIREWLYTHKRNTIKANSFDRLECTYLHQILPALDSDELRGIKLIDVTITHIQNIMNFSFERGYSYSTLKKVRDFLREFFEFCEDEIPRNPMRKYKLFSKDAILEQQLRLQSQKSVIVEKLVMQQKEIADTGYSKIYISEDDAHLAQMRLQTQISQNDIYTFSDDDIAQIQDAVENGYRIEYNSRSGNKVSSGLYIPKQGKFFLFMINSGIRAGEAVALRYSDFNYDAGTVRIQRNFVNVKERTQDGTATGKRSRTFTTPKTARSNTVLQLSPYAVQIIRDMQAQEPPGYDGYVVHSNHHPIAEKTLWQRFSKLLKGAGVQHAGLHSIRHTHGTKLYEATQDLKFVSQQLRHSDPSFTAKTYVHQSDQRTKEILSDIKI